MTESYAHMKYELIFRYYKSETWWHRMVGEMFDATDGFTKEGFVVRRLDGIDKRIAWKNNEWMFAKEE